jgi:hypothetical protein
MALTTSVTSDPPGTKDERLPFLERYFPKHIVENHRDLLEKHFLFDEIAATVITNHIIDRGGITLVASLATATEREPTEIAAAYLLAERAIDAVALRDAIEAVTPMVAETRYGLLIRIEDAVAALARSILWVCSARGERVTLSSAERLQPVLNAASVLSEGIAPFLPERGRRGALRGQCVHIMARRRRIGGGDGGPIELEVRCQLAVLWRKGLGRKVELRDARPGRLLAVHRLDRGREPSREPGRDLGVEHNGQEGRAGRAQQNRAAHRRGPDRRLPAHRRARPLPGDDPRGRCGCRCRTR